MPTNLLLPPPDLTPWHMLRSADIVVQSVIVALLLASVVTWTVLFAKWLELMLANRALRRTLALTDTAASLSELASNVQPQALITAANTELRVSRELPPDGIKSRIALR